MHHLCSLVFSDSPQLQDETQCHNPLQFHLPPCLFSFDVHWYPTFTQEQSQTFCFSFHPLLYVVTGLDPSLLVSSFHLWFSAILQISQRQPLRPHWLSARCHCHRHWFRVCPHVTRSCWWGRTMDAHFWILRSSMQYSCISPLLNYGCQEVTSSGYVI